MLFTVPNLITLIRLILALLVFHLLFRGEMPLLCFGLTILVIMGDYLDGYYARKLQQSSPIGAWFDIATDRFVELGFWIIFASASLQLISPLIPLIFLLRGIFVDGMRNLLQSLGYTAFGQSSMMQSSLGIILVSSRASRFLYAAVKMICFASLILSLEYTAIYDFAQLMTAIATVFCIVRGIPVLWEGIMLIHKHTNNNSQIS